MRPWLGMPLLLLLTLGAGPRPWAEDAAFRPNVLWVCLDAARADHMGNLGYHRPTTPHIDALAERGVTFTQCHPQADWTARSVSSYMTGRFFAQCWLTARFGQVQHVREPGPMEVPLPLLARQAGYDTALFTPHEGFGPEAPLRRSFDHARVLPIAPGHETLPTLGKLREALLDWVDQRESRAPFFAYVHALDTHFPHDPPPPYDRWVDQNYDASVLRMSQGGQAAARRDGQPLNPDDQAYLAALHDGSLAHADAEIGRLLGELDERGLLDKTVVLVHADHGDALGEDGRQVGHHGSRGVEEVLRVPWVMAGPGIPPLGRENRLARNADIAPTLAALLGLNPGTARFDGVAWPLVWKGGELPEEAAYSLAAYGGGLYESPLLLGLRTADGNAEYQPALGHTRCYQTPDRLGARRPLRNAGDRARLTAMHKRVLLPRWRAATAQPLRYVEWNAPFLARKAMEAGGAVEHHAFGEVRGDAGGKAHWVLRDGLLWAATPAPVLHVDAVIPRDRYVVRAAWNSRGRGTLYLNGKPLSLASADDSDGLTARRLGPFASAGGMCRLRIAAAPEAPEPLVIHWIRFEPGEGGNALPRQPAAIAEETRRLESLGYGP